MIKTWRKRLPMSPSAYSPGEVERVMQSEIDELRAALAEMTTYRDANNSELGRMTEKCNSLKDALAAWEINFKRQGVMLKNCDGMLKEANTALATARAEERERCDQLAFDQTSDDPPPGTWNDACLHIQERIRALTDEPAQGEG